MKKIIAMLLIAVSFSLAPQQSKAVPMHQIYREMQAIVYTMYGGSAEGVAAGNWYLQSMYGLTVCDVWFLHDIVGYDGDIVAP